MASHNMKVPKPTSEQFSSYFIFLLNHSLAESTTCLSLGRGQAVGRTSELEALWPCYRSGKRNFLGLQSLGSSWGDSAGFTLGQVL